MNSAAPEDQLGAVVRRRWELLRLRNEAVIRADAEIEEHNRILKSIVLEIDARQQAAIGRAEQHGQLATRARQEADRHDRQLATLEATIADLIDALVASARQRDEELDARLQQILQALGLLSRRVDDLEATSRSVSPALGRLRDVINNHADVLRQNQERLAGWAHLLNDLKRAVGDQSSHLYSVAASVDVLADEGIREPVDRRDSRTLPDKPDPNAIPDLPKSELDRLPDRVPVVMFASDPHDPDREPIRLDDYIREIQQEIRRAAQGERIDFHPAMAARATDLFEVLNRTQPHMLHITAHGTADGVVLTSPNGRPYPVAADALVQIIVTTTDRLAAVFFNVCDSYELATAAAQHVDVAIGMRGDIRGAAATLFSGRFYGAVASGRSVLNSFHQACAALRAHHHPEHAVPQLLSRRAVDPDKVVLVRPAPE
jgi:hypothetical protein